MAANKKNPAPKGSVKHVKKEAWSWIAASVGLGAIIVAFNHLYLGLIIMFVGIGTAISLLREPDKYAALDTIDAKYKKGSPYERRARVLEDYPNFTKKKKAAYDVYLQELERDIKTGKWDKKE